jgi:hypothetical protein
MNLKNLVTTSVFYCAVALELSACALDAQGEESGEDQTASSEAEPHSKVLASASSAPALPAALVKPQVPVRSRVPIVPRVLALRRP